MKAWLTAHAAALRAALRRLGRQPIGSLFEVTVFGIALALPLGLYVVVDNVRALAARFATEPEISVFVELGTKDAEVTQVKLRLTKLAAVDRITFVPREQASSALRQSPAMAEVLDALPENPLPDAFIVRLKQSDAQALEQTSAEIAQWPHVARSQVDVGWARKMEALVRIGWVGVGLLSVFLGLAAAAIAFNTVRLQMLDRRDEIELSRLIGATDGFIRRPFVYFGALQGFFGGAVALAIVWGGSLLVARALADISTAYGLAVETHPVAAEHGLIALGSAVLLGWAAAWLSASRALWARHLR